MSDVIKCPNCNCTLLSVTGYKPILIESTSKWECGYCGHEFMSGGKYPTPEPLKQDISSEDENEIEIGVLKLRIHSLEKLFEAALRKIEELEKKQ